ncbi:leucine-rich repeat and death domain-containing protein 1-like [Wyeomyia smithii]|uniref:leucine-rich repeat and death domain-containing protein 1-like n=1 Tax=Wyeomyia smithii TaxID=174621 RepID=UPI002467DA74|nr:leucine-rich repeat and death domain-containing protein 1-like [Wyeomyia smithii]
MGRSLMLAVFWLLVAGTLVSAEILIQCSEDLSCRLLGRDSNAMARKLYQQSNVRNVDLHGNLLDTFDTNILGSLRYLQSLNISFNLLQDIALHNLQLETIDITYNNISTVYVAASVKNLYAKRNQLHRIQVAPGSHMTNLVLSMNKLENLDKLGSMQSLAFLDLSCNLIMHVNFDDINTLTSLESLNLANNRITRLSGQLSNRKLKHIDLSNNWLVAIDTGFQNVVALETLLLQKNRIAFIETTLSPSVKYVGLSGNDWDCKKLSNFLSGKRFEHDQDHEPCSFEARMKVCCTSLHPLMAARLIKYHRDEFLALKKSSILRNSSTTDCSTNKPGPCDGDDELVYNVANGALYNSQAIVLSEKERLEQKVTNKDHDLKTAQSVLNRIRMQFDKDNKELNDLTDFIANEYFTKQLSGETDPLRQLISLFEKYETKNTALMDEIKKEEEENKRNLQELSVVEGELEELQQKKNNLLNTIGKHNKTITNYNEQIDRLMAKING